ncbi:MAG: hypothetical protein Kow00120_08880 [Anaerolineae bacterium]
MQRNQSGGHVIVAVILIGLGIVFFIGQVVPGFSLWSLIWRLWPFFIIVPGLAMFVPVLNKREAGLAVPASLVTGTGLILLYQSITGNWGSWAYVWTLYGVFLGFGMWLMGRTRGDESTQRTGVNFMAVGFGGFVIFGLFFGGFIRWGLLLPLVLIGMGAWFLYRALGGKPVDIARTFTPSERTAARPAPPTPPQAEVAPRTEPAPEPPKAAPVPPPPPPVRDILADTPLGRDIAEALAEDEAPPAPPQPETPESEGVPPVSEAVAPVAEAVTPVSEAVEPTDSAENLAADIEAEIEAAASAAREMIDRQGESASDAGPDDTTGGDGDEEDDTGQA